MVAAVRLIRNNYGWTLALLIVAGLALAACSDSYAVAASKKNPPAKVEPIEGSSVKRVTLTQNAADRLKIQTTAVSDQPIARYNDELRRVIPYAALLYDAHGATWTYTSPQPLVFIRAPVTVDFIESESVVLLGDDLAPGTAVVTVGAAELFGTETGVGK